MIHAGEELCITQWRCNHTICRHATTQDESLASLVDPWPSHFLFRSSGNDMFFSHDLFIVVKVRQFGLVVSLGFPEVAKSWCFLLQLKLQSVE